MVLNNEYELSGSCVIFLVPWTWSVLEERIPTSHYPRDFLYHIDLFVSFLITDPEYSYL